MLRSFLDLFQFSIVCLATEMPDYLVAIAEAAGYKTVVYNTTGIRL